MQKGEMLGRMIHLAVDAHKGQFDKGGQPYVLHALKVMHYLKSDDEELQCIAVGHDIIEDTDVTYQELLLSGMSERVVDGIRALTKVKGETYDEYKAKVKANADAIKVKMADLRHNTDIRRLKGVRDKDIARIVKYHNFYLELQELAKIT